MAVKREFDDKKAEEEIKKIIVQGAINIIRSNKKR